MKHFLTILLFITIHTNYAAVRTSAASGNWNAATTWVGGVAPVAGDDAIIANGHTVTLSANATITNCTVNTGGYLKTGTNGSGNFALTVNGTFTIQNGGTYENNNSQAWSTTIFKGTEVFGASSNIIVNSDDGGSTFISASSANFGNVTWNAADGAFYQVVEGFGFTRTFQGNLTIGSTAAIICSSGVNGNITFSVGGNFTNNGLIRIKQGSTGDLTINVGGTASFTANAFKGIVSTASTNGNGNVVMTVGNISITGGSNYLVEDGTGNITLNVTGTFTQSAGDFRGNYNLSDYGTGTSNFTMAAMNFTGGTFLANYACHTAGAASSLTVTGNCTLNYSATSGVWRIIGLGKLSSTYNNSPTTFTVGGTFTISGAAGEFSSNAGAGTETNSFQNVVISGGANNFQPTIDAGNAHATNTTINGNLTVSGGTTNFSQNVGTFTGNITGNVTISAGTINTSTVAASSLNLTVGTASTTWSQTGGTVSLCNTNIKSGKTLTLTGSKMGDVQTSRTITVETLATLWCDVYPVAGTGGFTLQDNSTLGMGNATGYTGNITVTGTKTNNAGTNLVYYLGNVQTSGTFTTTAGAGTTLDPYRIRSLTINKTAGTAVSLQQPLRVTGAVSGSVTTNLQLQQGLLTTTTANVIQVDNGATSNIGSATSYVNGPITKKGNQAFVFPTGKNPYWARIEMSAPTAVSDFNAEYFSTAYSNTSSMATQAANLQLTHVSLVEHWMFDRLNGTTGNTSLKLYWESSARSAIYKCDSLAIARWNGSAWENTGPAYSGPPCSYGATGNIGFSNTISSFSPITFSSLGVKYLNPLPIELTSFEATPTGPNVQLVWRTASEINNDYFTVEKSKDGINFEVLMKVEGAGNSNTPKIYDELDREPFGGLSYYRLKQTDFNGESTYSQIVPVQFGSDTEEGISVFPNPANEQTQAYFALHGMDGKEVTIDIRDITGRIIFLKKVNCTSDREMVSVEIDGKFSKGMFVVNASHNLHQYSKKLIVQ